MPSSVMVLIEPFVRNRLHPAFWWGCDRSREEDEGQMCRHVRLVSIFLARPVLLGDGSLVES